MPKLTVALVAALAAAPAFAHDTVKVTASTLNVRTGPSTGYSRIGEAHSGEIYVVVGTSGEWKKIWFSSTTGWVHGAYVTTVSASHASVTASSLNVRTGPGTGYSSRGSAPSGSAWAIIGSSGDWRKVYWGGGTGWMHGGYLSTGGAAPPSSSGVPKGAEDKYMLVAYDSAYASLAGAEGYSATGHAAAIVDALRGYLSDGRRFWITFQKGLTFSGWSTPGDGYDSGDYLSDLARDVACGNSTSHALVVGLTGRRASDIALGRGYTSGRHSVAIYPTNKRYAGINGVNRFTYTRSTVSQEIGHNFGDGGHHDDGTAAVSKSASCSMDGRNYTTVSYCGNHVTYFYNRQKSRGTGW